MSANDLLPEAEIRELLKEWGRWSRKNTVRLGYVCPLAIIQRDNLDSGVALALAITDAEAMAMDRALAELKCIDRLAAQTVITYFLHSDIRYSHLADALSRVTGFRCSADRARDLVHRGVALANELYSQKLAIAA